MQDVWQHSLRPQLSLHSVGLCHFRNLEAMSLHKGRFDETRQLAKMRFYTKDTTVTLRSEEMFNREGLKEWQWLEMRESGR